MIGDASHRERERLTSGEIHSYLCDGVGVGVFFLLEHPHQVAHHVLPTSRSRLQEISPDKGRGGGLWRISTCQITAVVCISIILPLRQKCHEERSVAHTTRSMYVVGEHQTANTGITKYKPETNTARPSPQTIRTAWLIRVQRPQKVPKFCWQSRDPTTSL